MTMTAQVQRLNRARPRFVPWGGLGRALYQCLRRRTPASRDVPLPAAPRLRLTAEGQPLCVACALCAAACPTASIRIDAGPAERLDERLESSRQRGPRRFDVDLADCLVCGLCVSACPEDAIRLGPGVAPVAGSRQALRLDRESLGLAAASAVA